MSRRRAPRKRSTLVNSKRGATPARGDLLQCLGFTVSAMLASRDEVTSTTNVGMRRHCRDDLTNPETIPNAPAWSLDGRIVYYIGNGDGHSCVWAQTIDPATGKASGAPFAVWHFHDARRTNARIPLPLRGLAISRDRIVLNVVESSGSAWMATSPSAPASSRPKP